MSDDIPSLESLLPPEAVGKIREFVAQLLSQQSLPSAAAPIGASAVLGLTASVIRPNPTPFSGSSASVNPQYVLQALLKDPEISKKTWASPEGVTAIASIGSMIAAFLTLAFLVEQGQQLTASQKQTADSLKAAIEQIEQFWLGNKDQLLPKPKPTPDVEGD
jgi:hypothetical protein